MMKWLLILFATYMLVLPCIPCNAADVCCEEESICFEEKTSPDCSEEEGICSEDEHACPEEEPGQHACPQDEPGQHSGTQETPEQHEHSATCPCCPSFSCNTCHSIVVTGLVATIPIMTESSFDIIPFEDKPLANFSAIIWQPPKVLC